MESGYRVSRVANEASNPGDSCVLTGMGQVKTLQ